MQPKSDRRQHRRQMCADFVQVAWLAPSARRSSYVGIIEDVSPEGLCINLDVPVPVGTEVHLHTRGFQGEAEVRYSRSSEVGYLVGLEFLDGYTWDQKKWRPKHLLETAAQAPAGSTLLGPKRA